MADCTVTPATLSLVLAQLAVTLPGATHVESPATLALALTMPPAKIVCSFPIISRKPSIIFSDEKSANAVLVGDMASGYPLLNKLFTFDARWFIFEMPAVPEAEKLIIMAYYENHKDTSFSWYNDQDSTWYEVCFICKPGCKLETDGYGDLWKLLISFRQTSP